MMMEKAMMVPFAAAKRVRASNEDELDSGGDVNQCYDMVASLSIFGSCRKHVALLYTSTGFV